jgi:hypothetical protein
LTTLSKLFAGFVGNEISGEIIRPRLQVEAVEHGQGVGIVRNFTFRKFKGEPHAVAFMTVPRSVAGGSFEPTDRLLKPGEPIRLTYTMMVDGADHPIYFLAKGYFLRKGFFIPDDPQNKGKCWVGTREDAMSRFTKDIVVQGEDIVELRLDNIASFPNGPGKIERDVLGRYFRDVNLFILPSPPCWNQKSMQGHFFEGIRDSLDVLTQKREVKLMEQVELDLITNLGLLTVLVDESLLGEVDHEVARPTVVRKPNDFLPEINIKLTFLLRFKVEQEISELLLRGFPIKVGSQDEVYLPLILHNVSEEGEKFRVEFRLFPRDLIQERSKRSMDRGLKFMPPYALHPGAENHNTYSKLLIILNKQFREDERPDEEKVKSAKLKASVEKRISERRHSFTDDKVKGAFKDRVAAKKRKEGGD